MKKLDFIQALRGIAAMLVVLYHFRTYLNFSFYNLGSLLFDSGSIGVDLFFMISGFIMVYTTSQKENDPNAGLRFIFKRIFRIVPLYWICTLLFLLFTNGASWFVEGSSWIWMSRGLFFIPMDLQASGPFYGYAPLFTGWTLNYEMLFYLIFGISLFFKNLRWYIFFGIFILLLIVVPIFSHPFSLDAYANWKFTYSILNFITNPIMFDFIWGIGIGFIFLHPMPGKNKGLNGGFLILSIAFFLFQYFSGFRGAHGITHYGISCQLVLLSAALFFKGNALAIPKWLVFLGDISYSLYITHLVILIGFENLMTNLQWNWCIEDPVLFLPLILGVILFSYLTSQLIEKRLSKFLNRMILGSK